MMMMMMRMMGITTIMQYYSYSYHYRHVSLSTITTHQSNHTFTPFPYLLSGLEYEHMARGLTKVLQEDPTAFDGERLANVTEEHLARYGRRGSW